MNYIEIAKQYLEKKYHCSIFLLFIPSFLSELSILSEVLGILPDQLLQIPMAIKTFNLYQFGEKVVGSVSI